MELNSASIENMMDAFGDAITKLTATFGAADAYGEKSMTWASGSTTTGLVRIIRPDKISKQFGYLVPGDAIAYIRNSFTVAQGDRIRHNSIDYEVAGIAQKKTHIEIAMRKLP